VRSSRISSWILSIVGGHHGDPVAVVACPPVVDLSEYILDKAQKLSVPILNEALFLEMLAAKK
jgi:hypothetical protein